MKDERVFSSVGSEYPPDIVKPGTTPQQVGGDRNELYLLYLLAKAQDELRAVNTHLDALMVELRKTPPAG